MTFKLTKTNGRDLTADEEKEIGDWWPEHPDATLDEVMAHFEEKFETSITQTRLMRIMMEAELRRGEKVEDAS